ncbi:MAG: helix-turn-helix transcriptional regulator [Burkholderiales bacterium]|nr:helix-turn-helix transcriptional regulator [Burkholderiales bacterium]
MSARQLMSTKEVADYLRLKERKIYDMVANAEIPHSRVSGKLLFPRTLVDEWVRQSTAGAALNAQRNAPAVIAGSSDPLLEWAVRESRCGLATMTYGSMDGIDRMVATTACAAAMHIPTAPGALGLTREDRNIALVKDRLAHLDCVLLEWAKREQGLVVAAGNPLKIGTLADLKKSKIRVILRQPGAGSYLLFLQLLSQDAINPDQLKYVKPAAQTESDIASAILDGRADAGLAVRAVARQFHLDFIPLTVERLDIAVLRPSYFDAPWQALMTFTRKPAFLRYAKTLAGYDIGGLGKVMWNA